MSKNKRVIQPRIGVVVKQGGEVCSRMCEKLYPDCYGRAACDLFGKLKGTWKRPIRHDKCKAAEVAE